MLGGKVNLKLRLTISIVFLCALFFVILGGFTYSKVGFIMSDYNRSSGLALATNAAEEIDGDKFETISSEFDEAYSEVYDTLSKYRNYSLVKYIYAMRENGDSLEFVVDTDSVEPASFGEEYNYLPSMVPAFKGTPCSDENVTSDKWGSYLSVYSPIFTSDGRVVGIVGIDIGVESIDIYMNRLRNTIVSLLLSFAVVAVVLYVIMSRDVTGRDFLTEILNYDSFVSEGKRLEKRGKLQSYNAILVNIKDFKFLNQHYGYNKGNEILRAFAKKLEKATRMNEVVARTGNDNFMLLVTRGHESSIISLLDGLELSFKSVEGTELVPVASRCGIYDIGKEDHLEDVMNRCSVALNTSRSIGKDVVYFEDQMYSDMLHEKEILQAFKKGLQKKEFMVYFQPKVDIRTNTLCGAEALVRWMKDGRIVPPGQFIPVLEKEGLITELDFYVFEEVCISIQKWIKKGLVPVRISSNFSKLHLGNPDFADNVTSVVKKYKVDTKYIDTEITESSGYSNFEALTKFINVMKQQGIKVSMDDFGTGYSSLSMLMDMDIDIVKIDKSFVDRMTGEDGTGTNMVKDVIRMLTGQKKQVICEGVETKEQVNILSNTDCHVVQGYYYDKPLPQNEFIKRLENNKYLDK